MKSSAYIERMEDQRGKDWIKLDNSIRKRNLSLSHIGVCLNYPLELIQRYT